MVDEIGEPAESENEDVKGIEKISSSSSSLSSISDEDGGKKSGKSTSFKSDNEEKIEYKR